MTLSQRIDKYLRTNGVYPVRSLIASSMERVEGVVVIPALAEKGSLFRTLASIARNPSDELCRSLVVCVVNNRRTHLSDAGDIRDNQETLNILKLLIAGDQSVTSRSDGVQDDLLEIARSGLRLACIDASSPGAEIPDDDGGVGTARKIGMDAALGLLNGRRIGGGVIFCLDADTLVDKNYLSTVFSHFAASESPGAVVGYAHQMPSDPQLQAAICGYEIFLRSYVMGLAFAGSPYAFHTIGSTMACTATGYVMVRGMNRREAAEDFHFLNKLAKIGKMGVIRETTVFPSPRKSDRVPFGTGRQMNRFLTDNQNGYRLYNPLAFAILKDWLDLMWNDPDRDPDEILTAAGRIHPLLEEFLRLNRFKRDWEGIRLNSPDPAHLQRQFHIWFDGLMTLRLIHHLGRSAFPTVALIDGLRDLLNLMQERVQEITDIPAGVPAPELSVQCRILEALRLRFPFS